MKKEQGRGGGGALCLWSESASGLAAGSWHWGPSPGCQQAGDGGRAARSLAAGVRDLEKLIY